MNGIRRTPTNAKAGDKTPKATIITVSGKRSSSTFSFPNAAAAASPRRSTMASPQNSKAAAESAALSPKGFFKFKLHEGGREDYETNEKYRTTRNNFNRNGRKLIFTLRKKKTNIKTDEEKYELIRLEKIKRRSNIVIPDKKIQYVIVHTLKGPRLQLGHGNHYWISEKSEFIYAGGDAYFGEGGILKFFDNRTGGYFFKDKNKSEDDPINLKIREAFLAAIRYVGLPEDKFQTHDPKSQAEVLVAKALVSNGTAAATAPMHLDSNEAISSAENANAAAVVPAPMPAIAAPFAPRAFLSVLESVSAPSAPSAPVVVAGVVPPQPLLFTNGVSGIVNVAVAPAIANGAAAAPPASAAPLAAADVSATMTPVVPGPAASAAAPPPASLIVVDPVQAAHAEVGAKQGCCTIL